MRQPSASGARSLIKRPLGIHDQITPRERARVGFMLLPGLGLADRDGSLALAVSRASSGAGFRAADLGVWRALLADERLFSDEALRLYLDQLGVGCDIASLGPLGDLLVGEFRQTLAAPGRRHLAVDMASPLAFHAPSFSKLVMSGDDAFVMHRRSRPIVVRGSLAKPPAATSARAPAAPEPISVVARRDVPTLPVDEFMSADRAIERRIEKRWPKLAVAATLVVVSVLMLGVLRAPLFSQAGSAPSPVPPFRVNGGSMSPVVSLMGRARQVVHAPPMATPPMFTNWLLDDARTGRNILTVDATVARHVAAQPVSAAKPIPELLVAAPTAASRMQDMTKVATVPARLPEDHPKPTPAAAVEKSAGPAARRHVARKAGIKVAAMKSVHVERSPSPLTLPDVLKPH